MTIEHTNGNEIKFERDRLQSGGRGSLEEASSDSLEGGSVEAA